MKEIKAPHSYKDLEHKISVFLAGSIETGKAEDWQAKVVSELKGIEWLLILNPRRDGWDNSWEQSINNPQFREQVEWELDALEYADYIVLYCCPDTKSPITLVELGLHAKNKPERLIVCCPEGFWRKGNVDIVCNKYGVKQVDTLENIVEFIKNLFY